MYMYVSLTSSSNLVAHRAIPPEMYRIYNHVFELQLSRAHTPCAL